VNFDERRLHYVLDCSAHPIRRYLQVLLITACVESVKKGLRPGQSVGMKVRGTLSCLIGYSWETGLTHLRPDSLLNVSLFQVEQKSFSRKYHDHALEAHFGPSLVSGAGFCLRPFNSDCLVRAALLGMSKSIVHPWVFLLSSTASLSNEANTRGTFEGGAPSEYPYTQLSPSRETIPEDAVSQTHWITCEHLADPGLGGLPEYRVKMSHSSLPRPANLAATESAILDCGQDGCLAERFRLGRSF
jgi:hypothetical protein